MTKALHVAADYYDDVFHNKHFFDEEQLRQMMVHTRSLGAAAIDWVVDDMWALYEDYPGGMDLLRTVVRLAHEQGLQFNVIYKPNEGGLSNIELPHTMPRPKDAVVWEDLRGLQPIIRPFNVQHPEMCLKRAPGDEDPGGNIQTLRLIKNDNEPAKIEAKDISIWISNVNGRFDRYEGTFNIEQSTGWRPIAPIGGYCRIVSITGLKIPADQRYVEVRLGDDALQGQEFRNEYQNIVELLNERGELIPCTPAVAGPPREHYVHMFSQPHMLDLVRYGKHPEVRQFLADPRNIAEHAGEMRAYARTARTRFTALHETRHLSVARGKLTYLPHMLNPVYPEVRQHWLDTLRFCLDCGADSIDIRPSQHGRFQEEWLYGFNEPVLKALGGRVNLAGARRIMGEAYTQFMREARELAHSRGKKFGVHLLSNFICQRDESSDNATDPMTYEWEKWVAELADFVTFRGSFGFRPETVHYVVDRFTDACMAKNIPFLYQSNRRLYKPNAREIADSGMEFLRQEMAYAMSHPGVTGYQIYEAASFMYLDEHGELKMNRKVADAVADSGFGTGVLGKQKEADATPRG